MAHRFFIGTGVQNRAANRFSSWLAAIVRRLGEPDALFLSKGYRVIAHDRRGHGRSSQAIDGQDMDHYAADVAALASHLDLRNAIHVGHSTGGGEADALCCAISATVVLPVGTDRCGAAIDGEDKSQSGRSADRSV